MIVSSVQHKGLRYVGVAKKDSLDFYVVKSHKKRLLSLILPGLLFAFMVTAVLTGSWLPIFIGLPILAFAVLIGLFCISMPSMVATSQKIRMFLYYLLLPFTIFSKKHWSYLLAMTNPQGKEYPSRFSYYYFYKNMGKLRMSWFDNISNNDLAQFEMKERQFILQEMTEITSALHYLQGARKRAKQNSGDVFVEDVEKLVSAHEAKLLKRVKSMKDKIKQEKSANMMNLISELTDLDQESKKAA